MRLFSFLVIFSCFWLVVFFCNFLFFSNIGSLLSQADDPGKVDVIICLSTDFRVKKAVSLYRAGYARRIIFTVKSTRQKALEYGIDQGAALVTAKDAQTTFQEALYAKELLRKHGFRSAMVVTDPYHLYRTRWTFQKVCSDPPVRLSFIGTYLKKDANDWWKNRTERHFVLTELPKIIYYHLYHGLFRLVDDPAGNRRLKTWFNWMLWKLDKKIDAWGIAEV